MKFFDKKMLALLGGVIATLGASSAHAVVDVGSVVTGIGEAGPAITLVAGAVLVVCALVATFKLIRRAL